MLEYLKLYALSFLGKPYIWGGDDPINGYDCSGLIICLLQGVGIFPNNKDTTSQGLYEFLNPISQPYKKGLGAIVFYGESIAKISHVAMMLDDDLIIESGGGNSKTLTKEDASKQNAYVRIRPLKYRKDLVYICMPNYLLNQKNLT